MSQLLAKIESIESVESLNIVTSLCAGQKLQMFSLELSPVVRKGKEVILACKPTSVAIAKPTAEIEDFSVVLSYANQLHVNIVSVTKGKLLSTVIMSLGDFMLESILSTETVERLALEKGERVFALIKANEISILEILDD